MPSSLEVGSGVSRRSVLALTLVAVALPLPAWALGPGPRTLAFYGLHTEERLVATYWADGTYDFAALDAIDRLLRDFRTGEVRPMDPRLMDILFAVRRALGSDDEYRVVSGYRSRATNEMLRRQGHEVARNSLHVAGRAIDVALAGRPLTALRHAARSLGRGGVGYYPGPGFVHLDTGPVRSW